MWRKIEGRQVNGKQDIAITHAIVTPEQPIVLKRGRDRSAIQVVNTNDVHLHLNPRHGMSAYWGIADYPKNGPTLFWQDDLWIKKQDIWVYNPASEEVEGVAWFTDTGERHIPLHMEPGRSYYLGDDHPKVEEALEYREKQVLSDIERFQRRKEGMS